LLFYQFFFSNKMEFFKIDEWTCIEG
jgi:hypothetical protein